MQNRHYWIYTCAFSLFLGSFLSCKEQQKEKLTMEMPQEQKELAFESRKIVDSAKFWWAHTPADVTGDSIADLVFINNNASGGYLGYYKGKQGDGLWQLHKIAEAPPTGGLFAGGDLECADVDGDGDNDVIGIKHPGEWTDAGAMAELFWYENTGGKWLPHTIGTVPDAVKDVSFEDFNKDGKMDVAILTFDEHTLSIFMQRTIDQWERAQFITENKALHEGMGTGDIDGDGYSDIVANGFVYYCPGKDITTPWKQENIDVRWNDQEGDWSRNGTKTFLRDLDNDGKQEIYIAHSERAGYPLALYKKKDGVWQHQIIADSIPACHTIQVYDFDLDGDFDVLAGINKGRAVNLDKSNFDVTLFLAEPDYKSWTSKVIATDGIYNGQAIDYDNDGDMDIFRYPDHEATDLFILENKIK